MFEIVHLFESTKSLATRICTRGGRIRKFKDPEPLQIQQDKIRVRSGSATFSILRSGSAPDPPVNNQTLFTTKRTKRNSKKNINRSSLKIWASFQVRTKKMKKKVFIQNSGVFSAKLQVALILLILMGSSASESATVR